MLFPVWLLPPSGLELSMSPTVSRTSVELKVVKNMHLIFDISILTPRGFVRYKHFFLTPKNCLTLLSMDEEIFLGMG
jgi:hypothetical protein